MSLESNFRIAHKVFTGAKVFLTKVVERNETHFIPSPFLMYVTWFMR